MNILQINTADRGGGAEGSAWNLFAAYQRRGHQSFMAVGQKFSDHPNVLEIPRSAPLPTLPLLGASNWLRRYNRRIRGMYPLTRTLDRLANPRQMRQFLAGLDETVSPKGCRAIPDLLPAKPDVIHCHNLHGWYFDMTALPELATCAPVIVNLRDTWLLSGHCAYFLDCQRWQQGCGMCPNLSAYPRVLRDKTAENLKAKAELIKQAKVHLTAPSQWLANQVAKSVLGALPCKIIPNGIDTTVFKPDDRLQARKALGLPLDAPVVLFAAAAKSSVFKDYETLWSAAKALSAKRSDVQFVCVGIGEPPTGALPNLRCVSYLANPEDMAQQYRAADVFWHSANVEAFGKTVTEAMACGTPVVATDIGGIPEQILPGQTGYLTKPKSPADFVEATLHVLNMSDEEKNVWRERAAQRGATFSLDRQADAFLEWYGTLQV